MTTKRNVSKEWFQTEIVVAVGDVFASVNGATERTDAEPVVAGGGGAERAVVVAQRVGVVAVVAHDGDEGAPGRGMKR